MTSQVSEYVQSYVESSYTDKLFLVSYKTVQENFQRLLDENGQFAVVSAILVIEEK